MKKNILEKMIAVILGLVGNFFLLNMITKRKTK